MAVISLRPETPAPKGTSATTASLPRPAPRVLVAGTADPNRRMVALLDVAAAPPDGRERIVGIELRRLRDHQRWRVILPTDAPVLDARFSGDARYLLLEVQGAEGVRLRTVETPSTELGTVAAPPFVEDGEEPCDWDSGDRLLCRVSTKLQTRNAGEAAVSLVQLGFIQLATGSWSPVGKPGCHLRADLSPDGAFMLVGVEQGVSPAETASPERCSASKEEGASSSGLGERAFEVWTARGQRMARFTALPAVPGWFSSRSARWDPGHPARLAWRGLRPGHPSGEAVFVADAPFAAPKTVFETTGRVTRLSWSGDGSLVITEGGGSRPLTWQIAGASGTPKEIWRADGDGSQTGHGR